MFDAFYGVVDSSYEENHAGLFGLGIIFFCWLVPVWYLHYVGVELSEELRVFVVDGQHLVGTSSDEGFEDLEELFS